MVGGLVQSKDSKRNDTQGALEPSPLCPAESLVSTVDTLIPSGQRYYCLVFS